MWNKRTRVFKIYHIQDGCAHNQSDHRLRHFCVADLSQLHKMRASPAMPPKNIIVLEKIQIGA